MSALAGIVLIVIGLIACFFGKQYYRIVLGLFGFVIGLYVTSGLLVGQAEWLQIVVSLVAGVLLGYGFYLAYRWAYVLFGGFLGLAIGGMIGNALNLADLLFLIVALILMVIGGLLGRVFADLIIRVATAFGGAINVIAGLGGLTAAIGLNLPLVDISHNTVAVATTTAGIISLVLVGLLGAVGFIFQSRNNATTTP
jgi:hypothetical protein